MGYCILHVIHVAYYSNGLLCSLHVIRIAYYSNGLLCSLHVNHVAWYNVAFSSTVLIFTYNKSTKEATNSLTHISSCEACSPSTCQTSIALKKNSKKQLDGCTPPDLTVTRGTVLHSPVSHHTPLRLTTLQPFHHFANLLNVGPSFFWDVTRLIFVPG